MELNWPLLGEIAKPIAGVILGFLLTRAFERRAKLVSFFLHANAVQMQGDRGPYMVHTHSVVLRNEGKSAATNVRLSHARLPAYSIFPNTPVTREELPGGVVDLVIPIIRPGEQLTIAYLYFPPLLFSQVHVGIKHDEGFAQPREVVPVTPLRRWQQHVLQCLVIIGMVALIYAIVEFSTWLLQALR